LRDSATRSRPSQRPSDASSARSGSGDFAALDARLEVGPEHAQRRALAVGLEIDTRDETISEQERQHVVTMLATTLRCVNLEPVPESEQPFRAIALPDQ
jgi:hypothetical protein